MLTHMNFYTSIATSVGKDWNSGESVYGPLQEGLLCTVSLAYAKQLLKPDSVLLNCLGRHLAFEVAIGLNGVVWTKAVDCMQAIVIRSVFVPEQ